MQNTVIQWHSNDNSVFKGKEGGQGQAPSQIFCPRAASAVCGWDKTVLSCPAWISFAGTPSWAPHRTTAGRAAASSGDDSRPYGVKSCVAIVD